MTDLEKHVNQPGRAKLVKELEKKFLENCKKNLYQLFEYKSNTFFKKPADISG